MGKINLSDKKSQKLRWFIVTDPEDNTVHIVTSINHTKAKIRVGRIDGNFESDWEAMSYLRCNVINDKLHYEAKYE